MDLFSNIDLDAEAKTLAASVLETCKRIDNPITLQDLQNNEAIRLSKLIVSGQYSRLDDLNKCLELKHETFKVDNTPDLFDFSLEF